MTKNLYLPCLKINYVPLFYKYVKNTLLLGQEIRFRKPAAIIIKEEQTEMQVKDSLKNLVMELCRKDHTFIRAPPHPSLMHKLISFSNFKKKPNTSVKSS
jgi:hypothetical protein